MWRVTPQYGQRTSRECETDPNLRCRRQSKKYSNRHRVLWRAATWHERIENEPTSYHDNSSITKRRRRELILLVTYSIGRRRTLAISHGLPSCFGIPPHPRTDPLVQLWTLARKILPLHLVPSPAHRAHFIPSHSPQALHVGECLQDTCLPAQAQLRTLHHRDYE